MTQKIAVNRFDDPALVKVIKETVCKGATDPQLQMFLQVCKRTGLDPFLKEIWFIAEKSIIMAARDGYLRVANEHPMYDGIETRVERDDKGVPIKAVCTVWRKDRTHPTICEAYYSEYKAASPVWTKYPSAMIGKVAEVLALKRSFAINGVVSEEEMDATNHPVSRATAAPTVQPTIEAPPVPEEVQRMWDHMTSTATVCEVFNQLYTRMVEVMGAAAGNAEYSRILNTTGGVNAPNLLKQKAARVTSQRMWESIKQAEALGISDADVPEVIE